jgi:hypothetical protein
LWREPCPNIGRCWKPWLRLTLALILSV